MRVMPEYIALIVERPPEKSAGGIFLPESARKVERPVGLVDQVGSGVTDVTVGDKVVFDMYAGTAILIEGIEYRFLKKADIYAIL